MAGLDLFGAAAGNTGMLQQRLEAVLRDLRLPERDAVGRFVMRVQENGRVCVNMQLTAINGLLIFGAHQNMYEWAAEQAELSGRPIQDILREKLGPYYDARVAFDGLFDGSDRFRYGALSIGGPGAVHYGEICVVFRGDFPADRRNVVYFVDDSLRLCSLPAGGIDGPRACSEASPDSRRGALAGLKHHADVRHCHEADWPGKLCSDTSYVEAVFAERPTCDSIASVRVSKADLARLREVVFRDYRRKLTLAEKGYAGQFSTLLKLLRKHGIKLEEA